MSEEEYTKYKTTNFLQKVFSGNAQKLLSALVDYQEVTQTDLDELRDSLREGGDGDNA